MAAPLGIIAGGGALPHCLVEAARKEGREVCVVQIEGSQQSDPFSGVACETFRMGAIGGIVKFFKSHNTAEVIMAGKVTRPSMSNLRPDFKGTKLLAKLGSKILGGDDALLRAIIDFLEAEGFKVVGIKDVAAELLAPTGQLGKHSADKQAENDLQKGKTIASIIGAQDIGQAVVQYNGATLAVEALEGTEHMIARAASVRHDPKGGVLIKACKPKQELRADLPTIGPDTVAQAVQAGLSGIAIEAGKTIMLDKEALLANADAAGLFVYGFEGDA